MHFSHNSINKKNKKKSVVNLVAHYIVFVINLLTHYMVLNFLTKDNNITYYDNDIPQIFGGWYMTDLQWLFRRNPFDHSITVTVLIVLFLFVEIENSSVTAFPSWVVCWIQWIGMVWRRPGVDILSHPNTLYEIIATS